MGSRALAADLAHSDVARALAEQHASTSAALADFAASDRCRGWRTTRGAGRRTCGPRRAIRRRCDRGRAGVRGRHPAEPGLCSGRRRAGGSQDGSRRASAGPIRWRSGTTSSPSLPSGSSTSALDRTAFGPRRAATTRAPAARGRSSRHAAPLVARCRWASGCRCCSSGWSVLPRDPSTSPCCSVWPSRRPPQPRRATMSRASRPRSASSWISHSSSTWPCMRAASASSTSRNGRRFWPAMSRS